MRTQKNTYYYYPEQEIVCKIYYQGKKGEKLYVNYHYKITWIDKKNNKISIIDPYDEEAKQMTFDSSILRHFQLPYCNNDKRRIYHF